MPYTDRPTLLRLTLLLPTLLSACFEPNESLGEYPETLDVAKCEAICSEYMKMCIAIDVEADGPALPSDEGCAEECQDVGTLSEKSGCVESFNAYIACADGLTDICEDSCEAKYEELELCAAPYCEENEHPLCPGDKVPQEG